MQSTRDGAGVYFPPPIIYLAGLAIGIVAGRLLHLPRPGFDALVRDLLGGALIVAGTFVMFAGAGLLSRRRTAIIPFKPASCLVRSGIFGVTRNPMYLGMALAYAGIAVLFDSLGALVMLAVVVAIIWTQVIAREEAYLYRAFGADYLAYKAKVRRWL
jgi:protein-S-isoprenylcysteine O-methyltransferase Ste14